MSEIIVWSTSRPASQASVYPPPAELCTTCFFCWFTNVDLGACSWQVNSLKRIQFKYMGLFTNSFIPPFIDWNYKASIVLGTGDVTSQRQVGPYSHEAYNPGAGGNEQISRRLPNSAVRAEMRWIQGRTQRQKMRKDVTERNHSSGGTQVTFRYLPDRVERWEFKQRTQFVKGPGGLSSWWISGDEGSRACRAPAAQGRRAREMG